MSYNFYRTLNLFHYNLPLSITSINDIPYVLIPSKNSFYIFNLQNLNLLFYININKNIKDIKIYKNNVFIVIENFFLKYKRDNLIYKIKIDQIQKIINIDKNFIFIKSNNNLIQLEDNNLDDNDLLNNNLIKTENNNKLNNNYSIKYKKIDNDIIKDLNIDEKPSFLNLNFNFLYNFKILAFNEKNCKIFNIKNNKLLFKFNLNKKILSVCNVQKNICAFLMEDLQILFYDIKKDKEILKIDYFMDFNKEILNFFIEIHKNYLVLIINSSLFIYDLAYKRIVFSKTNVLFSSFLDDTSFIFCTLNSIEIFYKENDKFILLKKRSFLDKIDKIIKSTLKINEDTMVFIEKEKVLKNFDYSNFILLNNKNDIFSLNIFKDEQNFFIKNFKDFLILKNKDKNFLLKYNKTIVKKFSLKENFLDYDFNKEKVIFLLKDKLIFFYKNSKITNFSKILFSDESKIKIFKNFIIVITFNKIFLYKENKNNENIILLREYEGINCAIDENNTYIAIIKNNYVNIYNIYTDFNLFSIKRDENIKDVIFIKNLNFLGLLDFKGKLHLYSTNIEKAKNIKEIENFDIKENLENKPFNNINKNFYKDLVLYRNKLSKNDIIDYIKGLNKEEVNFLIKNILLNFNNKKSKYKSNEIFKDYFDKEIENTFNNLNFLLNKILLYKNEFIETNDLKELKIKITEIEIKYDEIINKVKNYIKY